MRPADGDWTGRGTGLSFASARCVWRAHVVRAAAREQPAQSGLVRDDHVIEALASDRPDHALDVGVLPRRARGGADGLDVHAGDGGRGRGKRAITIMQEIAGCLVFREGVPKLLGDPGRRRKVGDGPVLRKNSRRDRLKAVLMMKTTQNRFGSDTVCAGNLVIEGSCGDDR